MWNDNEQEKNTNEIFVINGIWIYLYSIDVE